MEDLFYSFALSFLFSSADSLPPMPMMVNGFDHRPLERNSSTYSDFDDEEEDYPKEVSLFIHSFYITNKRVTISLSPSLSPRSQRVLLDRSIGKLGLSIAGGADHVSHVFGQGRPGIYISKVRETVSHFAHVLLACCVPYKAVGCWESWPLSKSFCFDDV